MKTLKIVIVLAALFAFTGNSFSQSTADTTKIKKKTPTIKKVYKSYSGCKKDNGECTYFDLEYQVVKSGSARDVINKAIKDSILKSVNIFENKKPGDFKTAAANFISEYESSLKESNNGAAWYLETEGRVNSNRKYVLSYYVSQSMYTGGAHPNSYLVYYNFDKGTGAQISLQNVFGANFETALNKIIDVNFRKMKGLSPTDNLQDKAGLFDNKITYTNNFAIEKKGIRFYYNSYDIAAYVYGPTDLFVPWSDLRDIMPDADYYTK